MTVPNLITFFRIGLVPVFLWLELSERHGLALACFAVAMASDVVDGALARLLNQKSKLGGLLDPIADKLLVFSALVCLAIDRRVPVWLLVLIACRDGLMAIGAVMVRRKNLEIPTAPTRIGKYATFALTCLIVLALARPVAASPVLDGYTAAVGFVAALCVVVSTGQYFARFGYLFFVPRRSRSSEDAGSKTQA